MEVPETTVLWLWKKNSMSALIAKILQNKPTWLTYKMSKHKSVSLLAGGFSLMFAHLSNNQKHLKCVHGVDLSDVTSET